MIQGSINARITKNRHNKQWLVRFTAKLSEIERDLARKHLLTVLRIENDTSKQKT